MSKRTSFTCGSFLSYILPSGYRPYTFLIMLVLATGAWVLPARADDTGTHPRWYLNPPQDAAYYYGAGSAPVRGEEWNAWQEARNRGLEAIARQVETRVLAMQADYNRQAGSQTSNFFVSISTQITQVVEYDTKPVKRERRGNTCYVLLRSPKDKARAIISGFIDQEAQKNPLFQKETAQTIAESSLKTTPVPPTPSPTVPYATRNSLGVNLALEWSEGKLGMGVELLEFHWSFLPFTSVGIGLYPFGLGGYDPLEFAHSAFGASLYAGFVYPLTTNECGCNARLYTDFVFPMQGVSDKGFMIGAGFDAGLALTWDGPGFDIRYRGVVYEGHYANSLGLGFVWMFND